MKGINIKVRAFRYMYFLLSLVLNVTISVTRHIVPNSVSTAIEIAWFLLLVFIVASWSTPRTLILGDDGSLCIGRKLFYPGTIKRIAWSNGSRTTFQVIPNNQWWEYQFVTLTGLDGMRHDLDKSRIKFWALQSNIPFNESQQGRRKKK